MKKFLIVLLTFFVSVSFVKAATYEEALIEVANAYHNKNRENNASYVIGTDYYKKSDYTGGLFQYDSYLKKFNVSPEDAQIDRLQMTVCSNVIYQIYKETFGISIPFSTETLVEYARNRSYDSTTKKYNVVNKNEVHYSSDVYSPSKTSPGLEYAAELNKITDKLKFYKQFAKHYGPGGVLKVGDIVVFRWQKFKTNNEIGREQGHALMIYSINESTGDVQFIEAASEKQGSDKKRKLSSEPSIFKSGNEYFNPLEDNIFTKTNFMEAAKLHLRKQNPGTSYLTRIAVIRLMEGKEKTDISTKLNVNNSFLKGKTVTAATKSRLAHPGMLISKTSSGHYGVVRPGEKIKYTIKIKNKSNKTISVPTIIEYYDTSKVKLDADSIRNIKTNKGATRAAASGGKITIEGLKVSKNQTLTIEYYVTVKDANTVPWNTKIESSGKVGNIKNATIVDRVGYKLSSKSERTAFENALKISSSKKGIAYVNEVYKAFYKNMGIKKETVLYGGIGGSEVLLYHVKSSKNNKVILDGLLSYDNKYIDHKYLRALGKYSLTEYHSVESYYRNLSISNYRKGDDWLKATKEWDARKQNYPVSLNLVDGDVIWIADRTADKGENKTYKEYVFIYYKNKIYSNYSSEKFVNGKKITDAQKVLERFLANLEAFQAYAIFRPLQYYGLETGVIKKPVDNSSVLAAAEFSYTEQVETDKSNTDEIVQVTTDSDDTDADEPDITTERVSIVDKIEKDTTETTKVADDPVIININKDVTPSGGGNEKSNSSSSSTDNKGSSKSSDNKKSKEDGKASNDDNSGKRRNYDEDDEESSKAPLISKKAIIITAVIIGFLLLVKAAPAGKQ